jgi:hypothetical protein
MSKHSPGMTLIADDPIAPASDPLATPQILDGHATKSRKHWLRRTSIQIALIAVGVFIAVSVTTWVMTTYVFVELVPDESSLELPQTRLQTMILEIPLAKVHMEAVVAKQQGEEAQRVFIVEIDSSVIVHGNTEELLVMESMFRSYKNRIEEAIDQTIRSSSPADIAEPDGQTIRGRIRDKLNQFYGSEVVKEVLFSHYRAFLTPIKSESSRKVIR